MKKRVLALVVVICALLFTACVSDKEYEKLEERVSNLEKMLGVYNQDDVGKEAEAVKEADNEIVNEQEDSSNSTYTYVVDDMSVDEIISECKFYFDNIPKQGQSYDDYYNSYRVKPVERYDINGVECKFFDSSVDREGVGRDVITGIRINGTQTEMDGSIGYRGKYHAVSIEMIIIDYTRAEQVYDSLYNIVNNDVLDGVRDNRDSTHWSAYADYMKDVQYGDIAGIMLEIMNMEKKDDGYHITATNYVRL